MKIGILYICTGKYVVLWKNFYLSCKKYFIPESEKEFFVFTDSEDLEFQNEDKSVHRLFQENLGWPGNTLRRYEMFLRIKERLVEFDYLIFFNANVEFLREINSGDFLPVGQENLVACLHPGYFNKERQKFTYEKNPNSTAFVARDEGLYYFAGGINGGKSREFIGAIEKIAQNIKTDQTNNLLAIWHDESHWNKYLIGRSDVKVLSPSYLYPEGWVLPVDQIIRVRDKRAYGGHSSLRGRIELRLLLNRFKEVVVKFIRSVGFSRVIVVKGGLGNQLFQYAYGRCLELSGKKVIFETSFFLGNKKDVARLFKLANYSIETECQFSDKKYLLLRLVNKVKRILGFNIEMYFQSEKYFSSISGEIRREFRLKKELSSGAREFLKKIEQCSSVSMHIRRGDYVLDDKTNKYHGVCSVGYYQAAMDKIKEKIGDPIFFVFSDDIEWAKENFVGENFVFVSSLGIEDVEELVLMSKCKHNIIANSSFSWWGAWLNENLEKIVIAPKKWFNTKNASENDIVPEGWVRL